MGHAALVDVAGLNVCACARQDGYFVNLANKIHPWLGYWVLVSACTAMLSQFNSSMSTYARLTQVTSLWTHYYVDSCLLTLLFNVLLQSVAVYKMLPEVLAWNPTPYLTPIPAILVHGVLCGILMMFSFETLVTLGADMSLIESRCMNGCCIAAIDAIVPQTRCTRTPACCWSSSLSCCSSTRDQTSSGLTSSLVRHCNVGSADNEP